MTNNYSAARFKEEDEQSLPFNREAARRYTRERTWLVLNIVGDKLPVTAMQELHADKTQAIYLYDFILFS